MSAPVEGFNLSFAHVVHAVVVLDSSQPHRTS
jgi:hypothetical protein